jgi:hypothetical protein
LQKAVATRINTLPLFFAYWQLLERENPQKHAVFKGFKGMRHGGFEPPRPTAKTLYLQGFAGLLARFTGKGFYFTKGDAKNAPP